MLNSYAPAPFWFLNHRLEDDEILRQLKLMKESGVSGFFIHPRAGLLTPYGSDEWFRIVRLIVEESAKLGLEAWLYDEDPFPSGAVGGRIMMENAAFIARSLKHKLVEPDENGNIDLDLGKPDVLAAFSFVPQEDGEIADIVDMTTAVGVLREEYFKSPWFNSYYYDWKEKYPHERAETFYPHMVLQAKVEKGRKVMVIYTELTATESKYECIPDCLNPDCVKRFIELTHEKYKEWVGEYFGTTIPGIFTDEPFLGGSLPWTVKLEETFREMHGYDLHGELYRLWIGTGEKSRRLRGDYWATLRHLYRTSFFGQLSDWCHANNLQFVGHVNSEENPAAHHSDGGAYANMKYLDSPGLDILGQKLGNREHPALLYGAHSICSAARQLGKERVLCEAMACNPHSFGPRDMRRVTNWLFSQGVNWIVPHGFHYSNAGSRKHDAGKSFFFQDQYFAEFPKYAKYTDRMGGRLAVGKPTGITALLQLSDRMAECMPAEAERAFEIRHHQLRAIAGLVEHHIEYENISTETVQDATVADGAVTVGKRRYTQVLVPCAETETSPFIEQMKAAGVQVFFGEDGAFDWAAIMKDATCTPLTGKGAEDVLVNRLAQSGGVEVFLFNNAAEVATVAMDGEWALWDADEDAYYRVEWPLSLSGYGACLLKEMPTADLPLWAKPAEDFAPLYQEWVYRPNGALITMSDWDIHIETPIGKTYDVTRDFCQVREVAGTELAHLRTRMRPIFDMAPLAPSSYPAKATYTATFTLPETDGGTRRLLIEGETMRGDWKLTLNGQPITEADFVPCNVYDFTNKTANVTALLKDGENTLTVTFEAAGEFDGLDSAMYII